MRRVQPRHQDGGLIMASRVFIAAEGRNFGLGTINKRMPVGYRGFAVLVDLDDGRRVLADDCNIHSADHVAVLTVHQSSHGAA